MVGSQQALSGASGRTCSSSMSKLESLLATRWYSRAPASSKT
jgi:hypothetical protein